MVIEKIDAQMLKEMFLAGAKRLDARKEYINELNVFPVPDGDTGTNMTMTIMSAANEVKEIKEPTMKNLARAISNGALRGARGNSGVILSQLFKGFTRGVRDCDAIDSTIAADAFRRASETAYKAVMKPKEGTILTVARGINEKAQDIYEETTDMAELLRQVIEYGNYMLSLTPEMLPVLKQAGVVDSGGKGLMTILEGAYDHLIGKDEAEEGEEAAAPAEPQKARYCVEYVIMTSKFDREDDKALREYLLSIGDTVVCMPESGIVKVHVHTEDPGLAVQKGVEFGSLSRVKINNMHEEHKETLFEDPEKLAKLQLDGGKKAPAQPMKESGFVAVSMGEGMKNIFEGLGVDVIVEGGQTMNPSTADILDAIEQVNAKNVYVMPNNKNIILAARQAVDMCTDRNVIVIPSKTVPQGITAVINFNESSDPEENEENMTEEMNNVKSAQVTFAVRDTTIDDKTVRQGDIMGLTDDGLAAVGKEIDDTVIDTLDTMVDEDSEIITLYFGSDITESDAAALSDRVQEKYPDCEVEVYSGGQPIYYYVMSVE